MVVFEKLSKKVVLSEQHYLIFVCRSNTQQLGLSLPDQGEECSAFNVVLDQHQQSSVDWDDLPAYRRVRAS